MNKVKGRLGKVIGNDVVPLDLNILGLGRTPEIAD